MPSGKVSTVNSYRLVLIRAIWCSFPARTSQLLPVRIIKVVILVIVVMLGIMVIRIVILVIIVVMIVAKSCFGGIA